MTRTLALAGSVCLTLGAWVMAGPGGALFMGGMVMVLGAMLRALILISTEDTK